MNSRRMIAAAACVASAFAAAAVAQPAQRAAVLSSGGSQRTAGGITVLDVIGQMAVGQGTVGALTVKHGVVPCWISGLRGDMNCDGIINNFDIDPFVLALTDAAAYALLYPSCDYHNADVDGNGLVNNFDIDPFVACLVAGVCP